MVQKVGRAIRIFLLIQLTFLLIAVCVGTCSGIFLTMFDNPIRAAVWHHMEDRR